MSLPKYDSLQAWCECNMHLREAKNWLDLLDIGELSYTEAGVTLNLIKQLEAHPSYLKLMSAAIPPDPRRPDVLREAAPEGASGEAGGAVEAARSDTSSAESAGSDSGRESTGTTQG